MRQAISHVSPAALRIVVYPDPVLKTPCAPVTEFGPALAGVAARMLDLMREARGVGLAAPQVGLSVRMFVYNLTGQPDGDRVCVNPALHDLEGVGEADEGCLSLPGVEVPVRRALKARLTYFDVEGRQYEAVGEGLLARVWQHENDHLDGKLIIDSMPPAAEIANRRAIKQLRENYKPPPR